MQDATPATEINESTSSIEPSDPSGAGSADPGSDSMLASILMIGGLSLAIFILFRRLYRRSISVRKQDRLTSREKMEIVQAPSTAASVGINRCMSEAEELTRRLAAILDNKAARLEILIDDAETKISQLESLGIERGSVGGALELLGEAPRLGGRPRIDPTLLDRARLDMLTLERNGGGLETPASVPADSVPPPPSTPTAEELLQLVYEHADTGLSALEISRKLDQPLGQIELMLNLRRQTG